MKQPAESDIEAAKTYLRQRLEAEWSMIYNLEIVMREAAERIVSICYVANVNPHNFRYEDLPLRTKLEIGEVIKWFRETIEDYFETLAIADHEENKNKILPFILSENHGMTFSERLTDYCDKYKDELMLLIGAGLFLGIAKSALAKSIGGNLKHPYANQLLADSIGGSVSYGRGRTNSMFTAISDLTQFGIAQGWMKHWELKTAKDGCVGWVVKRGSSYPCSACDDNCGFHSIDEGTNLPLHSHRACFAVPIYLK